MSHALRLLLHSAALVAGVTAGLLGSFVHSLRLVGLPVGLLCGLTLTAVAVGTAGMLVCARSGALAAAVGWVAPVLVLSAPRPEGDLVVPGSVLGYSWLLGGTVVAGVAVAWPYATSPAACRAPSADGAVDR